MLYIIYSGFEVSIFLIFKFSIVLIVSDFPCCFVFYSIVMLPLCFYIALAQNLWMFKKRFHVKYDQEALIQCFHGFFQTMGVGCWFSNFSCDIIWKRREREKRREKDWNATYIYNNFLIFSWCTVWKIWKLCLLISKSVNIFLIFFIVTLSIVSFVVVVAVVLRDRV